MSNNFWRSNSFDQGPVVRRLISANPSLNFNPDFYVLLFNHLSRISFSILRRTFNHQIVDKKKCTDFEQPGPEVFHFNILFKIFFFSFIQAIDDCKRPNICPKNFKCVNGKKSYKCVCPDGFRKIGSKKCEGNFFALLSLLFCFYYDYQHYYLNRY